MKGTERVFIPFELGKVFRKARIDRNMSQLDLANETDVSQSIISKIERGAYQANKDKLVKLCDFLGLELEGLSQFLVNKSPNDELDFHLQIMAIEHDMDMVDPDECLEELRRLEELRKLENGNKDPLFSVFHYLRGKYNERKQKWNDAMEHYECAIKIVDQYPDFASSNIKAASYNGLGRVCNRQNNFHQALAYIEKGIESFLEDGQRSHIGYNLLINKAIILEKLNRDSEALNITEELWPQKPFIKSANARLNLTQIRIELLNKLQRYDEAIAFALEGLEEARLDTEYDRCFDLWSILGDSYAKKGLYSNAEICYQSALKLENKIRGKHLTITTYTQLGLVYLDLGNAKVAQTTLEEAVERGKRLNDDYRLVKALMALGHCLLKQSQDLKALKHFKESLHLAKKHSFDLLKFDILLEITDICKRNNLPSYQDFMDEFQQAAVQLRKRW